MTSTPERVHANDGGRANLTGLIYQFLGVGAFAATVESAPIRSHGVEVLFSIVKDGPILHEHFGQDAVVESAGSHEPPGTRRRILLQFKFSNSPAQNAVTPTELLQIVAGFRASERVRFNCDESSCEFVLVTNRPPAKVSRRMIADAADGIKNATLGNAMQKKAERKLLQRLLWISASKNAWLDRLETWARERGILEDEFVDGISRFCGDLFSRTSESGPVSVTEETLSKHLGRCPTLQPMTPNAMRITMRKQLHDQSRRCSVPDALAERELLNEVLRDAREAPLVVLLGGGGFGKTVVLHRALQLLLDGPQARGYVVCEETEGVKSHHLAQVVDRWRHRSGQIGVENNPTALNRLAAAKGDDRRPIIICGLDGLDESVGAQSATLAAIQELLDDIDYTNDSSPKWSVILTCRDQLDFERVCRWVRDPVLMRCVRFRHVGMFSNLELGDAANEIQDHRQRQRIRCAVGNSSSLPPSLGDSSNERHYWQESTDPVAILALRHPVMWNGFVGLEAGVRESILNGENSGLQELAEVFINRFVKKFHERHRNCVALDVKCLLQAVARHTHGRDDAIPLERVDDWIEPAAHQCTTPEAILLWNEAIATGMISPESRNQWRWTHTFVSAGLADVRGPSAEDSP